MNASRNRRANSGSLESAVITEPSIPVASLWPMPWAPQKVVTRSPRSEPVSWLSTCGACLARTIASTTRLGLSSQRR